MASDFVTPETAEMIRGVMFEGLDPSDVMHALFMSEMERYVPKLRRRDEQGIREFMEYQKGIYLKGKMPAFRIPIASLNPRFIGSLSDLKFEVEGLDIFTFASMKENGFRIQLHVSPDGTIAFTRQFVPYDLRMFPELVEVFQALPLMIGDAELVNSTHLHMSGFHLVEERFPSMNYWVAFGEEKIPDDLLASYLSDGNLFNLSKGGKPLPHLELSLSFHGMFAIADPSTWDKSREEQADNMLSLTGLPIDHQRIDDILSKLRVFLASKGINARVADRIQVKNVEELAAYMEKQRQEGSEGMCIVQSARDKVSGRIVSMGRSSKVKIYEKVDAAVLALHLLERSDGLTEENVTGALMGLWDSTHGMYMPAFKVNLDPDGPQIKEEHQRVRQIALRREVVELAKTRMAEEGTICTLYDAFLLEGRLVIHYLFGEHDRPPISEAMFERIPRGHSLVSLFEIFESRRGEFEARSIKKPKVFETYIQAYYLFFEAISRLDKKGRERFFGYFSLAPTIKKVSAKLERPQFLLSHAEPIILECRVFDVQRKPSPYPSGFHSWFGNSFAFYNCYAERVRHDKSETTDNGTVHALAKKFSQGRKKEGLPRFRVRV